MLRSKLETEGLRHYSYASAYSFGSTAMPLQFLLLSALQLCLCSFFWLRELLVQQTLLFRAAGARDNLLEQAKEARDKHALLRITEIPFISSMVAIRPFLQLVTHSSSSSVEARGHMDAVLNPRLL